MIGYETNESYEITRVAPPVLSSHSFLSCQKETTMGYLDLVRASGTSGEHSESPRRLGDETNESNEETRSRWVADPRPDIAGDSVAWSRLLTLAHDLTGYERNGAFGVLHGLRCCGASLTQDAQGRYRLGAGELSVDEYQADREWWLMPRSKEVSELLRRLHIGGEA